MKHSILRRAIRLITVVAIPVSLQCCAPRNQSVSHGENVSYYFNSSFACPEHVPAWRPLGENGSSFRSGMNRKPGDASDAFEKALATLGQRSRAALDR